MLEESRSERQYRNAQLEKRKAIIAFLAVCLVVGFLLWLTPLGSSLFSQSLPPNEEAGTLGGEQASVASSDSVLLDSLQAALNDEEEAQSNSMAADEVFVPLLEETDAVGDDYFDDALFIGDSLTYGLYGYRIIPNAAFVSSVGINLGSMQTSESFALADGSEGTMMQALAEQIHPLKIYIMMGTNGINWLPFDTMLDQYTLLIDQVRGLFPNAILYIQSLAPTTYAAGLNQPGLARESICAFNTELLNLASLQRTYYLDVYTALADADGYLPEEFASADGVHFSQTLYQKWYHYAATHTAPMP